MPPHSTRWVTRTRLPDSSSRSPTPSLPPGVVEAYQTQSPVPIPDARSRLIPISEDVSVFLTLAVDPFLKRVYTWSIRVSSTSYLVPDAIDKVHRSDDGSGAELDLLVHTLDKAPQKGKVWFKPGALFVLRERGRDFTTNRVVSHLYSLDAPSPD